MGELAERLIDMQEESAQRALECDDGLPPETASSLWHERRIDRQIYPALLAGYMWGGYLFGQLREPGLLG